MPRRAKAALGLVAWNGKLIRAGECSREITAQRRRTHVPRQLCGLDPTSNITDIECCRSSPRTTRQHGNMLYVFGGWRLNGLDGKPTWQSTGYKLDLSLPDARWDGVDQPFRRRALTMAALGNRVYVIGGMNEAGRVERTVSVFDTISQSWSEGPALPVEIAHGFTPASAVHNEQLYVAPADGKLYALNEVGDAWVAAGQFREKRFSARMVGASDGRLLIIGGASPTSLLASVETVTPRTT